MQLWIAGVAVFVAVWLMVPDPTLRRLRSPPALPETVPRGWVRRHVTSRASVARDYQVRAAMSGVCDLLAVSIEAGRPPRAALRVVADVVVEPTKSVLNGVLRRIELGVDEAEAWRSLAESEPYRDVARDLARSVHSGVAVVNVLRHHAATGRSNALMTARERARTVSVKATLPLMLCFLPAFLLVGVVPVFGGLAEHFMRGW